jgi:hypothetical protein
MLADFVDLEESFFGFDKAPCCHKKDGSVKGHINRTYHTTIKKRRNDCALAPCKVKFLLPQKTPPPFGPPTKKLRQTTLTQAFPNGDDIEDGKPKVVIDLAGKQQP